MVTAVVGGQFGSEGKGATVGHIAGGYQVHVRVGAANAGHTVYVDGDKHVVQQLPVAAYANPHAKLVLGAGAMVSPQILAGELARNDSWRERKGLPPLHLVIDERAHVILPQHIEQEAESKLAETIGSTSATAREGIGTAQAARVLREGFQTVVSDGLQGVLREYSEHITICDTVEMLHQAKIFGTNILLEGTQGTGLDNVLGYEYPYVTSRHVTASGLAADCGFGPRDIDEVLIVARTFPIRVAGNSGPFWPDSEETNWRTLGVDELREKTTVTKKVRRVATFSLRQILYAARVNGATEIALNFADYLAPELSHRAGPIHAEALAKHDWIGPLVGRIEEVTQVPVVYVGTGPDTTLDRSPWRSAESIRFAIEQHRRSG